MVKYGKAAALILATLPVVAAAQSTAVRSAPQARSAAPVAGTPAPQTAIAPDPRRFTPNGNFYNGAPKPQPGTPVPANLQPGPNVSGRTAVVTAPRPAPVMQPTVIPPAMRPAVAVSAPVIQDPQFRQIQPVIIAGSNTSASSSSGSRAAVDYVSGKLTVVAENAPLSLVLKLIAAKTGAVVDLAPELQNEPVVAHLGPNPVPEVLSGLLDSPRIDYIVFGAGDEPGSLRRIVVRTRHSFGHMAMAAIRPQTEAQEGAVNPGQNPNLSSAGASPQQNMEQWQQAREEMRQTEIREQAEEREKEKTQPVEPPVAQNNPEPEPQQQQDNPPL